MRKILIFVLALVTAAPAGAIYIFDNLKEKIEEKAADRADNVKGNEEQRQDKRAERKAEREQKKAERQEKREQKKADKKAQKEQKKAEKGDETDTNDTDNTDKKPNATEPDPDKVKKADEAQKAYEDAKENQNSFENRMLTAATTAATSQGAIAALSAMSEKRVDAESEQDMSAYLSTFYCNYAGGQSFKSGPTEITIPGGNELLNNYQEYKYLADRLKTTKAALGMRPGIEQEIVYDKAESGLYKYASVGAQSGGFTSLSRALRDANSADAAAWAEQKDKSAQQLKTGAWMVAGGVAAGIIGNKLINGERKKRLREMRDGVKEGEAKLKQEFQEHVEVKDIKESTEKQVETGAILAQAPGQIDANAITDMLGGTGETPELETTVSQVTLKDTSGKALFASGSAQLSEEQAVAMLNNYVNNILMAAFNSAANDTRLKLDITGHTDKTGNEDKNRTLSKQRANAVKDYIETSLSPEYKDRVTYNVSGEGQNACPQTGNVPECRKVDITLSAE